MQLLCFSNLSLGPCPVMTPKHETVLIVHSKTADSDTVSTNQVSSVQLVTDKKLEAFNKA